MSFRGMAPVALLLALAGSAFSQGTPREAAPAPVAPPPIEAPGDGAPHSSGILRDPFRPFNLDLKPKRSAPMTPLEQYDLGALKLVAIIWSPTSPKAMFEDETGIGFTATVGTSIGTNSGVVKRIDRDAVVVEEEFVDFYGEKKKSETTVRIETDTEEGAR